MAINSNPAPVPVVCALIVRHRLVLLAQRPAHKHLGGLWEFPGGKVEPGETPLAAIVREIHEELGCDFIPEHELSRSVHPYDSITIEMIPFVGRLSDQSPPPQTHEHHALAWVKPEELLDYDLAPADFPVVTAYQQAHESRD